MDENIDQFSDDGQCTIEPIISKNDKKSNTENVVIDNQASSIDAKQIDDQSIDTKSTETKPIDESEQNINIENLDNENMDQTSNQIEDDESTTSSQHPPVDVHFKPNYVVAVLPRLVFFSFLCVF